MAEKLKSQIRVTYLSADERKEFNKKTEKQRRRAERKLKNKLQGREG